MTRFTDYTISKSKFVKPEYKLTTPKADAEHLKSLNPIRLGTGLPNVVREALAGEKRVSFSLLMDCAIRYGFCSSAMTIEQLLAQTALSQHTLRNALNDVLIRVTYKKTPGKGRPEKIYHIPDRDTVIKHVTPGNNGMSDHLPEWSFTSISNYRKARYYMLIARGCKYVASQFVTYSRAFLCRVIGVCKATLIEYENDLDMHIIHNLQETDINQWSIRSMMSNTIGAYLEVNNDGKISRIPAMRSLAYRALQQGFSLRLIQYLPNTYSIVNWNKWSVNNETAN